MNIDKESNSTLLKSKAKWWHIVLFWVFIVSIGIINNSCEESDEYYVKYEVISDSPSIGRTLHTTINTEDNENGTFTFGSSTPWETIIGPVQKGFIATLEVSSDYELFVYPRIYVSKNNSPFALKKSDESNELREYVEISYKINY